MILNDLGEAKSSREPFTVGEGGKTQGAALMPLQMEEGAASGGTKGPLEAGKARELRKGTQPRQHLEFSPVRPTSGLTSRLKIIGLDCSKPPGVWEFVTAATEN